MFLQKHPFRPTLLRDVACFPARSASTNTVTQKSWKSYIACKKSIKKYVNLCKQPLN